MIPKAPIFSKDCKQIDLVVRHIDKKRGRRIKKKKAGGARSFRHNDIEI
jgi:hypothetical protein